MADPTSACPTDPDPGHRRGPGEPSGAAHLPQQPGDARSGWSLRRWLGVIGAVCLGAAVAAIAAGALALAQLSTARAVMVDQLDPALLGAQALSAALVNQETGVRGFVTTGNREFLAPYQQGRQEEDAALATLRRLGTAESRPELTTGLDAVLGRIQAWRADYAEPTIAAVTASGPGGANVDPAQGKARFDALRAAFERQQTGLTEARANARDDLDSAANTLLVGWLAIGSGLLVLLLTIGIWVHRIITIPVERLAGEVRIVAAGQFGRQVNGQGPRELVELGTDIDSMRRQMVAELTTVQALNRRLDVQTAELQRSNSDLEQFAYVASHDLQEPLRKVSSFCELLAKRYAGQLDDRAGQYIHFAVDGARRMSVLINDLLAFSRVGRTATATWSQLDCDEVLTQAVRNLDEVITQTGARITRDPLPTVVGEAALLTTVFQNLLGNAIKFCCEQPPQIHVGVQLDDDFWSFRVSDNGIGIEPAYAEKIFVIFQRLHSKDAYPGTGIGLALCRKILDYHRGRIWLDPDTTSGSAFCFTLPAITRSEEGTAMTDPVTTAPGDD
ncbi:MAG: CHASE3 domain-containing protein [Actinomycetota bacterium]|nr:CHASE3 domain-containing protein [Actinomycetota bacterium]